MKMSEAVAKYIELRDKKAQMKAEYEALVAPVQANMEKLEAKLLAAFEAAGMDSIKTPNGTAYTATRSSATIADKDVFLDHVKTNLAWDLLEQRVSKAGVEQYQQENEGALPPGINIRVERVVNVRRAS